jgi:hypothetical protein
MRETIKEEKGAVAIYHRVYSTEGFEEAARALHKLVLKAQEKWPGKKRLLYLDIDGHRNSEGGFEPAMFGLQQEFLLGLLGQYLTEVHGPLLSTQRKTSQSDDVPEHFEVRKEGEEFVCLLS